MGEEAAGSGDAMICCSNGIVTKPREACATRCKNV